MRNPKSEIRNPKEARNPKAEEWNGFRPEIRYSDLFRISGFGFRISTKESSNG